MAGFYQFSGAEVLKSFATSPEGLSDEEARKRLKKYGPNELLREKGFRLLGFLVSQFKSPLVYILLIAGALSFWIKAPPESELRPGSEEEERFGSWIPASLCRGT